MGTVTIESNIRDSKEYFKKGFSKTMKGVPSAAAFGVGQWYVQNRGMFTSDGKIWKPPGLQTILGSGIPTLIPSSGTMGNNGAITLTTTMAGAAIGPCYLYLPLGAIYTNSPAGSYYTVMSSATLGTVYDSLYTGGVPTIPLVLVPFVTTGPGAYTQVTTVQNLVYTTLPGGAMGPCGSIKFTHQVQHTNSAGVKTFSPLFGGVSLITLSNSTSASYEHQKKVSNSGDEKKQWNVATSIVNGTSITLHNDKGIDTTLDVQLAGAVSIAVTTDFAGIYSAVYELSVADY